jgi:arylsulfatase A-like enzyme
VIRHILVKSTWVGLFALYLIMGAGPARADEPPRRVLWIAVDSLRADHLGYMGYERDTSPQLDALAGRSVNATLAFSPANSTAFSVASTFAGVYYSLLDHETHPIGIPEGVPTLAEVLQRSGIRTHAWITNTVLMVRKDQGYGRGFEEWHDIRPRRSIAANMDELIAYVEDSYTPTGGREFHYIHTMDVHKPYQPPLPFDRLWPMDYSRGVVRFGGLRNVDGSKVISNFPYHSEGHDVQPEDVAFLTTQYDGAIRYTDDRLPRLLAALAYDEDRDLLIISADHGEQLFEHGFWGHDRTLYREEIHVPLLLRHPAFPPATLNQPVSLIDLYPTLCALYGLSTPEGPSGVNLLPHLRGESAGHALTVYTEAPYWTDEVFAPEGAVISGGYLYKLVAGVHYRRPWIPWPFEHELFNLGSDLQCTTNLVPTEATKVDELNAVLLRLNPRFAPYMPAVVARPDDDSLFGPSLLPGMAHLAGPENPEGFPVYRLFGGFPAQLQKEKHFVMHVTTSAAPAFLLEATCRLERGTLRLAAHDKRTRELLWAHTLRKPAAGPKTVQAVVYPKGPLTLLTASITGAGRATLTDFSFRPLHLPTIEAVRWKRAESRSIEEPTLTPETRESLKALGYID